MASVNKVILLATSDATPRCDSPRESETPVGPDFTMATTDRWSDPSGENERKDPSGTHRGVRASSGDRGRSTYARDARASSRVVADARVDRP